MCSGVLTLRLLHRVSAQGLCGRSSHRVGVNVGFGLWVLVRLGAYPNPKGGKPHQKKVGFGEARDILDIVTPTSSLRRERLSYRSMVHGTSP